MNACAVIDRARVVIYKILYNKLFFLIFIAVNLMTQNTILWIETFLSKDLCNQLLHAVWIVLNYVYVRWERQETEDHTGDRRLKTIQETGD